MTELRSGRLASLTRSVRKLQGRSFAELKERASQAVAAELERRGRGDAAGELSDRTFWSRVNTSAIGGAASAQSLREHFRARAVPRFFAGVRDGSAAAALRSNEWSQAREQLLAAADRVLENRYDLLGHIGLNYGDPIDWHLDPVSGKRGPLVHWSRIAYLDAARFGDHKVIWEINRHQHFFVLGRAWQITREPRYAQCFVDHAVSWMDANPPKRGINWASSLEVSYRAIAWLWAIELFRDAPELTGEILVRMLKYLDVHGRHLQRYLSTYFSPNTHLTGEALGLLYLGTMLPELTESAAWKSLGWQVLMEWLPRQVYEDGVYFEQATYYHRYTADIFLHAVMLAELNGTVVPESARKRLTLALDHLGDLTRPDGTIPIIGDDDGGRLTVLEQRSFMDVRAVLATAALVLERPQLASIAGTVTEEVLWLFGNEGVRSAGEMIARNDWPAHTSKLFPVGGYAVLRDTWDPDAFHAVMDCGPLGAMNCGHAHSDALSVELSIGGCPLIIDPGTYSYTSSPEARDKFRHSASHNTVTIDGEAASVPSGPFSWRIRADARPQEWWSGRIVDRAVGTHSGFDRLEIGARHQRVLWFVRGGYWVVQDLVDSNRTTEAVAHYHIAMGGKVEQAGGMSGVIRVPCRGGGQRLFFEAAGDVQPILWGEDWVSPSYGSREKAPYARLVSSGAGPRQLIAVLCPQGENEAVSVQELPADKGRVVAVSRPTTYDQLLLGVNHMVVAPGLALHGDGALIRRAGEGGAITSLALFGPQARLELNELAMTAVGAAEATLTAEGWKVEGNGRIEMAGSASKL